MKKIAVIAMLLLASCAQNNPDRKKLEEIAKRNPLDMADEPQQSVVIRKEQKKPQYPKVPTIDAKDAPFVSGKHSKVYHVRGCEYCGKLESPVGYDNWQDAERSGRIPCEFCKPHDYVPPAPQTVRAAEK